jgi:hypothetical protein
METAEGNARMSRSLIDIIPNGKQRNVKLKAPMALGDINTAEGAVGNDLALPEVAEILSRVLNINLLWSKHGKDCLCRNKRVCDEKVGKNIAREKVPFSEHEGEIQDASEKVVSVPT